MDESFLTGEPYQMSKAPGSTVLSGRHQRRLGPDDPGRPPRRRFPVRQDHAGDAGLRAEAAQAPAAGRPARRPLHAGRRGASPGPGLGRSAASPTRFLAVLVVATPCPLLIAIPVAIIGSISLSARRGIIIKDPAVLETIDTCRTAIFDKTGTLTYGAPRSHRCPRPRASTRARCSGSSPAWSATPSTRSPARSWSRPAARRASRCGTTSRIQEHPGQGLIGHVDGRTGGDHQPQQAHRPAARRGPAPAGRRTGVRRPDRRPVRRHLPLPRSSPAPRAAGSSITSGRSIISTGS